MHSKVHFNTYTLMDIKLICGCRLLTSCCHFMLMPGRLTDVEIRFLADFAFCESTQIITQVNHFSIIAFLLHFLALPNRFAQYCIIFKFHVLFYIYYYIFIFIYFYGIISCLFVHIHISGLTPCNTVNNPVLCEIHLSMLSY